MPFASAKEALQHLHAEAVALAGVDEAALGGRDVGGGVGQPGGSVVGDHDRTVTVGVDQIPRPDVHPGDGHRDRVVDDVHMGV